MCLIRANYFNVCLFFGHENKARRVFILGGMLGIRNRNIG